MQGKIVIIDRRTGQKTEYTPKERGFWTHYPQEVKEEAVSEILRRNIHGESVASICHDLCTKYARAPVTLMGWFRELA